MNSTLLALLKKSAVALLVATLVFAKQIGLFLVEENRYYMLWRFTDGLALLLDVILLAAILVAVSHLLHVLKWDRARRVYNHLFLLVLGLSCLTLIPEDILHPDAESPRLLLAELALVALVAFSLGYARSRLVQWATGLCLVFSPLVLILFFQLLTAPTWDTDPEPRPDFQAQAASKPASPAAHPVFMFVFDEWSVQRTTGPDGEFLPAYPHLRELSAHAFTFQNARSQSSQTKFSLPAIVFQTDRTLHIEGGRTYWEAADGQRTPTTECPSLFRHAREQGYHTALLGFYLPYRKMLGDQVDSCRAFGWYPKGEGLVGKMGVSALYNLKYLEEPVSQRKRDAIKASMESERFVRMNHEILRESLQLIADCPRNTFSFVHWPLPHGPFVLNADGSYRGPYTSRGGKFAAFHGTPEEYEQHLRYMDKVMGQIVEQLKKTGKYDDALLIFTADHSWRYDPAQDTSHWKSDPNMRRIPLLIKFPGQKKPHRIARPFPIIRLQTLIDAGLRGDVSEDTLFQLIGNS